MVMKYVENTQYLYDSFIHSDSAPFHVFCLLGIYMGAILLQMFDAAVTFNEGKNDSILDASTNV